MIDFTSRQLRAFLLVAQHHSFIRAAEALFITPSGLSVLIRQLENHLGFRLFDRTTRHVALTAAGSRFLAVARRSLGELDQATTRIGRSARGASDTLSVGAGLLIAANILPPAIREFRAQRPDVRIHLIDASPLSILAQVQAGALDMGLGFFATTPGLRRIPFFRFSLMVVRPEMGTAPARGSTTWSALKSEQLILQTSSAPLRQVIDRHLTRAGVDARAAIVVNSLEMLIAMVEAQEGTGIVPSFALPACRRRNVAMSRLTSPSVPVDVFQIQSRGRKPSRATDEFTTFLQGYIARWAGRTGVL
jgi:LysR family transcriptional regulator, carnitine catabolism transcriptional activator